MTDLEIREAFKAWFKKEYLGIDILANQGDEGAITRRDYAYVGYQAAKAESHKQAALYQFEINHLAQANEQWREKAAKAQAIPEGFVLVPKTNSDKGIESMAMRYRHDFPLLDANYQEVIKSQMRQLYEEAVGLGFYSHKAQESDND